jgi:hypothetical protein
MESHNLPRPIWVDPGFIDQAMNIVETLVNLNYLTSAEAEDPHHVRYYASQSEERLQALGRLLMSIPIA